MRRNYDNLRINIFFACLILISGLILYRLFILSYVKHYIYSKTAEAQSESIQNILSRGNIYFKDPGTEMSPDAGLNLAATNRKFPLAHMVPLSIVSAEADSVAQKLADILKIDKEPILKIINSGASGTRAVARKLTIEQVEQIKALNIKGVGVSYENDRFYPNQELGANALGFLGYGETGRVGQYGIEAYYDQELFGKVSAASGLTSEKAKDLASRVRAVFTGESESKNSTGSDKNIFSVERPSDIVLTIDKNIQIFIEDELENLMSKWQATQGTIIVQEPNTGKILAIADRPTFNPNFYSSAKPEYFLNQSTQEFFEPGSSFKPITMAAGLDLAKVTPQTTFVDNGFVEIAGYKIKNFSEKVFGKQTMAQVLEKSINTGAMYVENQTGDENFLDYLINFGFGQRTGVDLPGEVNGDITNLYSGRKINYLTASFGQGIAVTPIQLVNAYSAIANGGKLMRPYLVEKIIRGGEQIVTQPEIVSIPISDKTSQKLRTMLVSVVDNGFDKARIAGYDVAGKTGTAQIADGEGGYLENEFIHDFLGFAPAYNPKFVILIKMDRPKGITFAADSLSPSFREIANFLINYYKIPPTR